MEVITKARNVKSLERHDYRDALIIEVDGKNQFSAHDGEPEDNSLSRNFSDCYSIVDLMRLAWEAGRKGEDFIESNDEIDW